ncbi:helix-turn-helix transcriptional regulator [Streptomyces subrutilus]|uniref:helix-turn-helix transcriptional regulator n=1 Tax=Streptomyces subrutilus TaxID=36818 RepID=UPI0033EDBA23
MVHNDRSVDAVRIDGARLRELRIQRGYRTQGQLAAAIGCTRSTVSTWEASKSTPRPATLSRVAGILGVSPNELMHMDGVYTLKKLRTSAGLLQADMANLLGVATSTYCDVERQRQKIPKRWLPALAQIFRISTPDIRSFFTP